MSKKTLKIAAIVMLVLNLGLIALLIIGKPPHHEPPRERIINTLSLDDEQVVKYDKLIEVHRAGLDSQNDLLRKKKEELFGLLASNEVVKKDAVIEEIVNIQKEIENIHFDHFLGIRELVETNKDQLNEFNTLAKELGKMFAPRKRQHHRP